jgi:nitrosocyanin
MRRWTTAALIVATAGLVFAGCGGGGGKKAETSETTAAASNAGGGNTVNLVTKDFMFEPATFTATAGKPVTVNVKNEGQAEHNFSIESLKVNQDIEKGESKTVTFTPTQSGSVQFFCEYHKNSHGMVGTLNVT